MSILTSLMRCDVLASSSRASITRNACTLRWAICRRQIAQRRVQAFLVIDALDELANTSQRISEVNILIAINLLVLQRLDERFRLRVVVRVAASAHADQNLMLSEQ